MSLESVNETFKGRLNLEQHRGRTPDGVIARVMQRILALAAAIWHNDHTGQLVLRSLTAYDHCPLGIDHLDGGRPGVGRAVVPVRYAERSLARKWTV